MLEWWLAEWVPRGGRVFVDVGANVGTWSRWLAPRFESGHAIEPDPDALAGLRAELPANVEIHPVAAWSSAGTITVSRFADSVHTSAHFAQGINSGQRTGTLDLPCSPLDELAIKGPVDLIKCDTEGAELEVLRGGAALIARDRPWLLVEAHTVDNVVDLTRLLTAWDYLFTIIRHPEYRPYTPLWYGHCWLSCQPRFRLDDSASSVNRPSSR